MLTEGAMLALNIQKTLIKGTIPRMPEGLAIHEIRIIPYI
jgi:hypothetical protein